MVCHEHVGLPRRWTNEEIGFAESAADLVALVMEQAAHIEARRALDELAHRAEEDRRLASLGRVAAAIAHDFNNLLSIVQVRAEHIVGLADEPAAADCARVIIDTVRRSRDLSRQLAELGRGHEEPVECAELDEVVAAAGPLLSSMAPEGRTVILRLGAGAARVPLVRVALDRVLTNLVVNAFDASSAGDTVDVETRTVPGADGTYAVLCVSDRGHGIDPETRSRIFEPYFTTRRAAGGSGLGLAIVHATVQRAGGFIDVETAPGEGTTVRVFLPVSRP